MPNRILRDWTELKGKTMAPYESGVYAFVVNDEILYIGSTWCLRNRCSNHPLKRFLKQSFDNLIVYYKPVAEYVQFEKELIAELRPRFNIQYLKSSKKSYGKAS